MAQMVIRNFDEELKVRLKVRALRHDRSMEEEVREILRNALKDEDQVALRLGSRISNRFRELGLDAELQELRGQMIQPMDLSD